MLIDADHQRSMITARDILTTARRDLSIAELACALALGDAPEDVQTVTGLEQTIHYPKVMNLVQMHCHPVDSEDLHSRQVRCRHRSVTKPTETDEAHMVNICVRYLLLGEIGQRHLWSSKQRALYELPQEQGIMDYEQRGGYDPLCTWMEYEAGMLRYDPAQSDPSGRSFGDFFAYAACYWLKHLSAITDVRLLDVERIEDLCKHGSVRLQNWTMQYCRPECTTRSRFSFDCSVYDPLGIISLYGSERLLSTIINTPREHESYYLPDSAMEAVNQILLWGDISRIKKLFIGKRTGAQLRSTDFFILIIRSWHFSDRKNPAWDSVFGLVDDIASALVKEKWGNELLCVAASNGCMPLIRRLLQCSLRDEKLAAELMRAPQREIRVHSLTKPAHQSIGEAVRSNHPDVVNYLLSVPGIEAHLRHRNANGETVLHIAADTGKEVMFEMLVPRLREYIMELDHAKETALARTIRCYSWDMYKIAQILNGYGKARDLTALKVAEEVKDAEMYQYLENPSCHGPPAAFVAYHHAIVKTKSGGIERVDDWIEIQKEPDCHCNASKPLIRNPNGQSSFDQVGSLPATPGGTISFNPTALPTALVTSSHTTSTSLWPGTTVVPPAVPSPTSSSSVASSQLSTGDRAGIGVGVGVGVPIIGVLGLLAYKLRRRKHDRSPSSIDAGEIANPRSPTFPSDEAQEKQLESDRKALDPAAAAWLGFKPELSAMSPQKIELPTEDLEKLPRARANANDQDEMQISELSSDNTSEMRNSTLSDATTETAASLTGSRASAPKMDMKAMEPIDEIRG
ncbi:hypothetical protein F5Y15DRAFT_422789 [Xylariaceae sp. FL0016]|nr:hypothetical protein F5Y15DRAFT_422789 [Xylariaceae sp. FL0016]